MLVSKAGTYRDRSILASDIRFPSWTIALLLQLRRAVLVQSLPDATVDGFENLACIAGGNDQPIRPAAMFPDIPASDGPGWVEAPM